MKDCAAVASANSTMLTSMTGRAPQRSSSQPITGPDSVLIQLVISIAEAKVARPI